MAEVFYNLGQITNHTAKNMHVDTKTLDNGEDYYVFTKTHFGGMALVKMGYICEPSAFHLPIYIQFNGVENTETEANNYNVFRLGKTGIFEVQPELFIDKNNNNAEKNIEFNITAMMVPANFSFSIDYITAVSASN